MHNCNVTVKLVPDGCGLEIDSGLVYSIGNQNIDVEVTDSCDPGEKCVESSSDVLINGEIPPVEVCDGDEITVTLDTICFCGSPIPTCEITTPLFVTSRFIKGKLRFSLSTNSKLERLRNKLKIQKNLLKKSKLMMGSNHELFDESIDIDAINKLYRKDNEFWIEYDYEQDTVEEETETLLEEQLFSYSTTIFVVHNQQKMLNSIPNKPYLKKVHLNSLDVGKYADIEDQLCENRFYLAKKYQELNTEYIGLGSAKWGAKYPHQYKLHQLHNLYETLDTKVVLVAQFTPEKWSEHSEFWHPGMLKYLQDLSNYTGLPLDTKRAFFANNFICHRNIFYEFIDFWHDCYNYLYNKYNLEFDFKGGYEHVKAAYMLERITMLYFSNRDDLLFKQIPQSPTQLK